jgi:hypothetical protein
MPNPHFSVSSLLLAPLLKCYGIIPDSYGVHSGKTNFCILNRLKFMYRSIFGFGGYIQPVIPPKARRGKVPLSVASVKPIPLLIVLPLQFVARSTLGRPGDSPPVTKIPSRVRGGRTSIHQTVQCRILIPAEQDAGMVQIWELAVEAWINGDRIAPSRGYGLAGGLGFRVN